MEKQSNVRRNENSSDLECKTSLYAKRVNCLLLLPLVSSWVHFRCSAICHLLYFVSSHKFDLDEPPLHSLVCQNWFQRCLCILQCIDKQQKYRVRNSHENKDEFNIWIYTVEI